MEPQLMTVQELGQLIRDWQAAHPEHAVEVAASEDVSAAKVVSPQERAAQRASEDFMASLGTYFLARHEHQDHLLGVVKTNGDDMFSAAKAHRDAEAAMKQRLDKFYEAYVAAAEVVDQEGTPSSG